MKIFYWTMVVLILGTLMPSILFFVLHLATGSYDHGRRAKAFWNTSKVIALFGINLLIWGHVAVGLWQIWF
jgi:hypothetical protein